MAEQNAKHAQLLASMQNAHQLDREAWKKQMSDQNAEHRQRLEQTNRECAQKLKDLLEKHSSDKAAWDREMVQLKDTHREDVARINYAHTAQVAQLN